jgi:putative transposase
MPRGPRLDAPGVLHHVIARGIERREIFRDDTDRTDFLARLSALALETETPLYAWALIPNHFHLLLRSGAAPISALMSRLLGAYAPRFNRRHHRVGYLFQGRFKSTVVEEEPYFLELLRYIHLNPVRACIVAGIDELDTYPWTGHAALLTSVAPDWQDTAFVLAQFGATPRRARQQYRAFVTERVSQGHRPELVGGGLRRSRAGWKFTETLLRGREHWAFDERVLGSSDFVQRLIEQAPAPTPAPAADPGAVMPAIIRTVAHHFELASAEIVGNCHRPPAVIARAVVSYLAMRRHGLTPSAVAAHLGVSRFSVARGFQRAQQLGIDSEATLHDLLG